MMSSFSLRTPRCVGPGSIKVARRDSCTFMLVAALFTIAKIFTKLKCPLMDELKNKTWYIYNGM